jgi:polyhydroxyalkanoate synthesis regulator phasin
MFESTTATEATPSIEELQQQIASLKVHAEIATQGLEGWARRFDKIKSVLEEFIEEGTLEEGGALQDYLIEEFELDTTKDVEVTITITCSATMTIPRNDDVTDYVDYLDIDVDISTSKGEISWVSQDDASIEEA